MANLMVAVARNEYDLQSRKFDVTEDVAVPLTHQTHLWHSYSGINHDAYLCVNAGAIKACISSILGTAQKSQMPGNSGTCRL